MSTITYIVKVVSAQFTIDDAVAPKLTFRDGDTYVFDQADSSNANHTLQFSITSNNSGASEYTTGVTKTGTPGSAGAKTTIVTSGSTADTLYFYSPFHLVMNPTTVVSGTTTLTLYGGDPNSPSGDTADLTVGQAVAGTFIPSSTTIAEILTSVTLRMSAAATGNKHDGAATFTNATGVGGQDGSEFSNSGFNTTSEGILKPIVGGEATSEKWGPMVNHAIDQIVDKTVPKSGGTFTGAVIVDANLTVSGTTTTINTALTVSDAMVVNNAGSDVGVKVNSTSSGHILQLQDSGVDKVVVADGGATTFSAGLVANTADINGGTIDGCTITGNITGNASGTAATVTSGTQASITTTANLTTVGALGTGSIATGFGNINNGSNTIATTGAITGGSFNGAEIREVAGNSGSPTNIGVGSGAVDSITTGNYNTGVGKDALTACTSGSYNTAHGMEALAAITTGTLNTATGYKALKSNIDGYSNVANGMEALYNSTGYGNTAMGDEAGKDITTGARNIAIGYKAGRTTTTGNDNITIGYDIDPTSSGASNEINIGNTIYGNTSTGKVGIGTVAPPTRLQVRSDHTSDVKGLEGFSIQNNSRNQLLKLHSDTNAASIIQSADAGNTINYNGGTANTGYNLSLNPYGGFVGIGTTGPTTPLEIISGSLGIKVTCGGGGNEGLHVVNNSTSRFWVKGNGTGYLNNTGWGYSSDRKLKENIIYLESTLDKINSLKPCSFDYIDGEKNNLGFVAQDVQGVVPEAIQNISDEGEEETLSMKTNFIIPLLTKAVQELSAKVTALENA